MLCTNKEADKLPGEGNKTLDRQFLDAIVNKELTDKMAHQQCHGDRATCDSQCCYFCNVTDLHRLIFMPLEKTPLHVGDYALMGPETMNRRSILTEMGMRDAIRISGFVTP